MNRTHTDSIITPKRGVTACGLAISIVLSAGAVRAADCDGDGIDDTLQTYTWQATIPGIWSSPGNWFSIGGGVPSSGQLAVFDGASGLGLPPYSVSLVESHQVQGLNVLNGQTTIDLNGQLLDVTGIIQGCRELLVGGQSEAMLVVTGAGQLHSNFTRLAEVAGTNSTLQISGLLGPVSYVHSAASPLVIGQLGTGKLELISSTLRHDGRLMLGSQTGSTGSLTSSGNSQITLGANAHSDVVVGSAGQGIFQIRSNTLLDSAEGASLTLGELATGTGEFDLFQTSLPQTLELTTLDIGLLGSGLLRVRQGSSLTTPVLMRAALGTLSGSQGEARITTGSLWQISGQPLQIGPGGTGILTLGETARVDSASGIFAFVDGVIAGSGEISGIVQLVGGEIAPNGQFATSNARQQLHFLDDLQFAAINPISGLTETGRMTFTLATNDPAMTMSALVHGSATVDGTLRVSTIPGFNPVKGQLYPVLESATLTGTFDSIQSQLLSGGLVAEPVYPGDNKVYVRFVSREVGESDLESPVSFTVPGNFSDGKVADVTGDGFPDLVALSDNGPGAPGEIIVATNLGTGADGTWQGFSSNTLSFSTIGDQPRALDIGDMNDDSYPDIVVLNAGPTTDQIRIRLNNPAQPGDFSGLDNRTISVLGTPIDLVLGDINGDESLDVITIFERAFIRGPGNGGIQTSENNGTGFDDTDGDTGDDPGSVDTMGGATPSGVASTSKAENSTYIFGTTNITSSSIPTRGPTFPLFLSQVVPTGRSPDNMYTADLDGDGLDDVITSDYRSGTISVMRATNNVPGQILYDNAVSLKATEQGDNSMPGPIVALDINGNGLRDLVFTATDVQGAIGVRAILNLGLDSQGAMLFSHSRRLDGDTDVLTTPIGLAVADLDMDGREDLIVLRTQAAGPSLTVHLAPGTPSCNAADIAAPFGVLDLADINTFITAFISQDPIADLTGDGLFDLSDISVFVTAFLSGCP